MQKSFAVKTRKGLFLSLFVLGLAAALIILPYQFSSEAGSGSKNRKGLIERTESHGDGIENYDIRADKSAFEKIAQFRQSSGKDAAAVADIRESFVRGEETLRSKVPTLKVEYNLDIRTPEVIAPDVKKGRNFLTSSSGGNRAEILRNFAKENESLIGVSAAQFDGLRVTANYTNPDGNLSFAHLEQFINDVPVFRGEIKAGFTKSGEMIRVINNLAPGLDYESLSNEFRNPTDAVKSAADYINLDANKLDLKRNDAASNDLKAVFGNDDWATTAEKMYFPTEPGVARTAWRVLIWQPVNAHYVIVDAETGAMLWRKNITEDQTQSITLNVYANPNAMVNVADSPFPFTPGPTSPNGAQGAGISRTMITRIGNEAPYTFNVNGWITDGGNETDGNAVEAGLDRDTTNGVDVANGRAIGTSRTFNFPINPLNPNNNTGDAPIPAGEVVSGCASIVQPHGMIDYQRAAVTQLFHINNWYHDELYRLGFTEAARNFQNTNFTGMGLGNDRVSAEAQDCSGTNNANFGTPADGGRGRMQMYIWTAPNPDIDGDLDADVIIHEFSHGLSNRLHGNASGLSTNMARAMGEGWGDFYGHAMLSQDSDPINGIYTTGGYDTYLSGAGVNNYYYAIRRFPKAVMAFTGGPNNRPHNPMTFADIDGTQQNLNDGAFAPRFVGTADQVHNAGEVWSSALWEVRAKLVTRLGWADGNRKTLQLVTDGMKLAPLGPTFLQERDAILAAAQASSAAPEAAADVVDTWAGFATRGMGFSAVVTAPGTGTGNTRVVEAFDLPNLVQTPIITVSDSTGDNDGFPEPGEPIVLTIPLTNNTGNSATGTTLQVVGGSSANYGTIANGQTVSRNVSHTVPSNTPCGSEITLTINVASSLGPTSFTYRIIIGVPMTTFTQNFDGVTAPAFPAGWTATPILNGTNFVTTTTNPDTPPNSAYALDPITVGGGTDLTSPTIPITASAATVSFRNRYDTEPGWDGGVLEISVNGGPFQDIITAGGRFIQNGYNGVLGSNGVNNPLVGRNAWNGNSNGYINSTVRLPAAAAGQNIQLKWRFGADDNTSGQGPNPGWYIDEINVVGTYGCSFTPNNARARIDFDGDGKTDISIFRPSVGEWWYQRSFDGGVYAAQFGSGTDKIAAADFTGDGKDDLAFWRPSTGEWFVLRSEDSSFYAFQWGTSGDVPVGGDFDNDGKADAAVFRPSNSIWYILRSTGGTAIQQFGQNGDVPVVGDYDGDGSDDIAIFRPSVGEWWIQRSTAGLLALQFGNSADKPVQGDYTGDGKADVAFWRPSSGEWFVLRSEDLSYFAAPFGTNGDHPSPGDYDGDGKSDFGIFRPSNSAWFVQRSTGGVLIQGFGIAGDLSVPAAVVP